MWGILPLYQKDLASQSALQTWLWSVHSTCWGAGCDSCCSPRECFVWAMALCEPICIWAGLLPYGTGCLKLWERPSRNRAVRGAGGSILVEAANLHCNDSVQVVSFITYKVLPTLMVLLPLHCLMLSCIVLFLPTCSTIPAQLPYFV